MGRLSALSALLLYLAGCAAYSLVPPSRYAVGEAYSVDPQIAWSKLSQSDVEIWTVDGPLLQSLRLYAGIEDGEALFQDDTEDLPVFRDDMLAGEVVELIVDSITREGASGVRSSNLRPAPFGGQPGYRVDLEFVSDTGLEMRGLAAGAVTDGRLHLILYVGTASHYFSKHERAVDRLIDSVAFSSEPVAL